MIIRNKLKKQSLNKGVRLVCLLEITFSFFLLEMILTKLRCNSKFLIIKVIILLKKKKIKPESYQSPTLKKRWVSECQLENFVGRNTTTKIQH